MFPLLLVAPPCPVLYQLLRFLPSPCCLGPERRVALTVASDQCVSRTRATCMLPRSCTNATHAQCLTLPADTCGPRTCTARLVPLPSLHHCGLDGVSCCPMSPPSCCVCHVGGIGFCACALPLFDILGRTFLLLLIPLLLVLPPELYLSAHFWSAACLPYLLPAHTRCLLPSLWP